MKKVSFRFLALVLTLLMALPVMAGATDDTAQGPVRIAALKGPTGIGLVGLMENDGYTIELAGAPDEVVAMVASGQVDIAAVPTNLAPTLYQKLNGGVQLLALNTLGVLYILEAGDSVQSITDLAGKELYSTGQGSMPEYVLHYVLDVNGIADDVTVEYKAEHSELATLAAAGQTPLAMLPEPHVTAVLTQNPDMRIALDMTQVFADAQAAAGQPDSVLSMGVMIVRREFAEQNPEAIAQFLSDYEGSVAFVNGDTAAAAEKVAEYGILPSAAVAEKAIPNCHIVLIHGADMRAQVEPLLQLLYDANPASVGGALPEDDFYYAQP